jgi:hypothetical protein
VRIQSLAGREQRGALEARDAGRRQQCERHDRQHQMLESIEELPAGRQEVVRDVSVMRPPETT